MATHWLNELLAIVSSKETQMKDLDDKRTALRKELKDLEDHIKELCQGENSLSSVPSSPSSMLPSRASTPHPSLASTSSTPFTLVSHTGPIELSLKPATPPRSGRQTIRAPKTARMVSSLHHVPVDKRSWPTYQSLPEFPSVVRDKDETWADLVCPTCHGNLTNDGNFINGIRGFKSHMKLAHRELYAGRKFSDEDIVGLCRRRSFPDSSQLRHEEDNNQFEALDADILRWTIREQVVSTGKKVEGAEEIDEDDDKPLASLRVPKRRVRSASLETIDESPIKRRRRRGVPDVDGGDIRDTIVVASAAQ